MIDSELLSLLIKKTNDQKELILPEGHKFGGMISASDIFEPGWDIYINLHTHEINNPAPFLHGHDFFELNYVLSGNAIQQIDKHEPVILDRSTLCIMNPNARHNLYVESPEDMVLNIAMKPSLFNTTFWFLLQEQAQFGDFFTSYYLAKDSSDSFLNFHLEPSDDMDHLISDILSEYIYQPEYSNVVVHCLLILFFTAIMRQNHQMLDQQKSSDKATAQIMELLNYLSNNYETATIKSTADHFHYHPNYLSRFIKEHTGRNFRSILNDIKASHCSYYLINTNLPLADVAEKLGFSQMCNFYDFTKKNYNMTPAQYRLNNTKGSLS